MSKRNEINYLHEVVSTLESQIDKLEDKVSWLETTINEKVDEIKLNNDLMSVCKYVFGNLNPIVMVDMKKDKVILCDTEFMRLMNIDNEYRLVKR